MLLGLKRSHKLSAEQPIGLFDSGLGGLTVLNAVQAMMPGENLIYFGDTARVPYGSKSEATVQGYAHQIAEFLLDKNVKLIVIACNTATAFALDSLAKELPVPVIGVIEPGVMALHTEAKQVSKAAVIATKSTVRSKAYENTAAKLMPDLVLYSKACPLLVPLIEEGFLQKKVTQDIIHDYMDELVREEISHVILGCTHYPLLKPVMAKMYPHLVLVDSSVETAKSVKAALQKNDMLNKNMADAETSIYVSDIADSFQSLESLFTGNKIHHMTKVNLDKKEVL